MSCCGSKRRALSRVHKVAVKSGGRMLPEVPEQVIDRDFEFIGKGRFTYTGSSTGRRYHFLHSGYTLGIAGPDVAAAMAQPGLSLLPLDK